MDSLFGGKGEAFFGGIAFGAIIACLVIDAWRNSIGM